MLKKFIHTIKKIISFFTQEVKMEIDLDFRLLDISLEIYALQDHFELIKKQIPQLIEVEKSVLKKYRQKENLNPEDPEWDIPRQEFDEKVEFLLPRFFWGPFVVSLYAVYETAITEIAKKIQTGLGCKIALNDIRGDLLERANKYYKNILNFELCNNNTTWQRIKMLSEIRNAIAHVNGRLEMLNSKTQQKIKSWEDQKIGISTYHGYLIVDERFSKETYGEIRFTLEDLVARYKEWDTEQKSKK